MKLEDITLSETNQTNIVQFYLYKVARVVNLIVRENRMVAIRGWGCGGVGSYFLMVMESHLGKMKKF